MAKIKIKNFGPIREGFVENDGFLPIPSILGLIGNQGSGKSSVAKLISTCSWLEKAFFRREITKKSLTKKKFVKTYCGYQNVSNYFKDNTIIHYIGDYCEIVYENSRVNINNLNLDIPYTVPQIMYVPAERNFLSAVDRPQSLKNLPRPLYTFLDELEKAENDLSGNIDLPVNDIKFKYQKNNKLPFIVGDDYEIRLSESSSGLQSMVPLFIVSRYLTKSIKENSDPTKAKTSLEEQRRIEKEVKELLNDPNMSPEVRKATLLSISSRYKNGRFLNIVEEIEQNLYPKSQKNILYKLLEYVNNTVGNELILTTHSPYIINYLTLAVKAYSILKKIGSEQIELKERLNTIVPLHSCISSESLIICEINDRGKISKLEDFDGMPSDDNYLNSFLAETNELFDQLLEIEDEL